ncbi:MAG: hypothetical protein V2G33_06550 [bacterium JZ-2024 1]
MEILRTDTKNSASKRWKFQKPTQRILSPYLCQQKWKFPKTGTKKILPAKVEIPKPGQKISFPPPYPQNGGISPQGGMEKRRDNHNEAKGGPRKERGKRGKTLELTKGEEKWE